MRRDEWLAMSDSALVEICQVDRFRASGPGGQKRNKTESAVRIRHPPTGAMAVASESRSQHVNRRRALLRLREALAFAVREPLSLATFVPPPELAALLARQRPITAAEKLAYRYLAAAGVLLDVLAAADGSLSATAATLGTTTAALSRILAADPRLLRRANEIRAGHNLRALHTP